MKNLNFLLKAFVIFMAMLSGGLSAFAYDFEVDGIYYNITDENTKTIELTYQGSSYGEFSNEYSGSVNIPSSVTYNGTTYSVTSIGDDAFYYCRRLTEVIIPNSIIKIGNNAFYSCTGLTSVTIGNSVTSMGYDAFYDCSNLKELNIISLSSWCKIDFGDEHSNPILYAHKLKLNDTEIQDLVIPNDITEIKNNVFYSCNSLTSVTIPNSVTSIGYDAFSGCSGLKKVNIPNSVTSIGSYAFYDCLGLSEVTIGNSVTSIGVSAFSGCLGVKELTIGNSVTEIGQFAFNMCSGLTSVTIPNSVTSIGGWAFSNCYLESVISYCETPPTCGNRAFDGSYSARLSVPEGTKDAYANADEWEKFTNINENSGVDGVETEGNAIEVARHDIYGRQLNQPTKGINIIKMSDGTTRKEMEK